MATQVDGNRSAVGPGPHGSAGQTPDEDGGLVGSSVWMLGPAPTWLAPLVADTNIRYQPDGPVHLDGHLHGHILLSGRYLADLRLVEECTALPAAVRALGVVSGPDWQPLHAAFFAGLDWALGPTMVSATVLDLSAARRGLRRLQVPRAKDVADPMVCRVLRVLAERRYYSSEKELAHSLGICERTLSRRIKASLGLSLGRLIVDGRRDGRDFLIAAGARVAEVAACTQYGEKAIRRDVRAETGLPLSGWRAILALEPDLALQLVTGARSKAGPSGSPDAPCHRGRIESSG